MITLNSLSTFEQQCSEEEYSTLTIKDNHRFTFVLKCSAKNLPHQQEGNSALNNALSLEWKSLKSQHLFSSRALPQCMYVGEKYWQEELDHQTHLWIIHRSNLSKIKQKLVYAAAIGVKMESAGRDCDIGRRRRRRQNKTNHIYQHHHYLPMTLDVTIDSPTGYTPS